ncbi:MAG: site-specific DNA-methyltransferase [Planctomycetota bacterium]
MKKNKSDLPEIFDLRSRDILAHKVADFKKVFPEAITEDGKIDFDRLKRAMGHNVDVGKERYGMQWPGKADCFKVIQTPTFGTLRPSRKESVSFDVTNNIFIEGDNLEALKILQKSYLGKVKMIFIDPPYNTGGDFIYPDNFSESLGTYLKYTGQVDAEGRKFGTNSDTDGRFHSKWLNLMYPRLYLARNLLKDDGVIFVTIDDREVSNLRKVLDEVFGEENFVTQIEWQKRYTRSNNTDNFTSVIDHICVYQRSEAFKVSLLPRGEETNARFTNLDNDPRGPWKPTPFLNQVAPERRPNLCYPIKNPTTGKITNPTKKAWRYERSTFERLQSENRLYWGKDGKRDVPDIKTFLSEVRSGMTPINFWSHEYAGHTDAANREIKEIFGEKIFDTPKPTQLVMRMLEHCQDPNALVLDFFAGSGTTAHAVMSANRKDGGNRNFILVQLPEPTGRKDFLTIADLTMERLRRVVKIFSNETEDLLARGAKKSQDFGFRVYKLAESNFKPWNADVSHNGKALEDQLALHVNHIRKGSSSEDILSEILLKSGFLLTTHVETLKINGKAVYSVADGALLICLERKLTLDLIRAMAEKKPERVVCLDEGFAGNDQLKTNAVQTFKTKGVTSFKTV